MRGTLALAFAIFFASLISGCGKDSRTVGAARVVGGPQTPSSPKSGGGNGQGTDVGGGSQQVRDGLVEAELYTSPMVHNPWVKRTNGAR